MRLISKRPLHEAHEADVIHRDVKPGNVIVTSDGQPVLVDFGVATMLRDDTPTVTKTGQTPGTPQYMSPEQTSGRHFELDRRTDIYSLGVTLYECLTLRLPFKDDTDVPRQIMFVPVPDPRAMNHAISKDLKTVIETALEKDRERRYRTAADFADDLRCVREHEAHQSAPRGDVHAGCALVPAESGDRRLAGGDVRDLGDCARVHVERVASGGEGWRIGAREDARSSFRRGRSTSRSRT